MRDLAELFNTTEKPKLQEPIVTDELIKSAIEAFNLNGDLTPEEIKTEQDTLAQFKQDILKLINRPLFPRVLFDPDKIKQEYQGLKLDLGTPFLAGLYTTLHPATEFETSESWEYLVRQRQAAIDAQPGDNIVPRPITESRMLGYLIGKIQAANNFGKESKESQTFDTELGNLVTLAQTLAPAFRTETGVVIPPGTAIPLLEQSRD